MALLIRPDFFNNGDQEPQLLLQELRRAEQHLEVVQAYVRELRRLTGTSDDTSEKSARSKELVLPSGVNSRVFLHVDISLMTPGNYRDDQRWVLTVNISDPNIISRVVWRFELPFPGEPRQIRGAWVAPPYTQKLTLSPSQRQLNTYSARLYLTLGYKWADPEEESDSIQPTFGYSHEEHWMELKSAFSFDLGSPHGYSFVNNAYLVGRCMQS